MDLIAESELNSTQFKKLIADQSKEFDLILIECFHPVMYALAGRFKAPVIGVSSLGVLTAGYDVIGNPVHPVLFPDVILGMNTGQLTIWQKIKSVLFNIWSRYYHHNVLVPRSDKLARKYFGNDIPYVGDLERNMSMLFLNVNPLIYPPRANVPMIVEMGQMHIKPVKPLPIVAHPNIKAFVTQGGLQSTEEAISRGVPLVGMPFMGDQPMNVQKLVEIGIAVGVDPVSVTKDELKKAIIEVAENCK
ncbi:UDPGT domain containing protein [Asbolus verrucosus]|uniref:UDPGT domain containing protein n=1 Tax=Asbolus verrucosus TaxID=1661398 RepID=A0A482VGX1_ASBVE|nr:UDPGT domain containing protein [Asbolus verrucosus]